MKGDKAVNWKGVYNGATAYIIDDALSYIGSSYICKLASTGNLPTNTTYFDLFAQKGTDGAGAGDMLKSIYDTDNNGVVDNSAKLENKTYLEVLQGVYPVGCIYTSTISTNPSTVFGFGTWTAFGAGRCLVGVDTGQTEFDTVEEVGGAKTHTLTIPEMPAHTHTEIRNASFAQFTVAGGTGMDGATTTNTGSTGGGGSHNNLQPYITVYFWKRTA